MLQQQKIDAKAPKVKPGLEGLVPPPKPVRDIKQVWTDYKQTRAEPLRNILMENYLHLVRYNAERIHVKLPDEVELDDLMSAGIFGLMDAIAAFDLERGVKFETYCAPPVSAARSSTNCVRWIGCLAWYAAALTSSTPPANSWKSNSVARRPTKKSPNG